MNKIIVLISSFIFCGVLYATNARAEFIISSAIIEFTGEGERQQDIELMSRSTDNDYIVSEVSEVDRPGAADEVHRLIRDPNEARLLVTPDKTILPAGGSKVLRFVLLKDPDESEHIYRVAVKPVIKGVETASKVGLKVLIGYEVLVIVRPANIISSFTAKRDGKKLTVTNNGNTNVVFQNGKQCRPEENCKMPTSLRVYAGQTATAELPAALPVIYSVWDGKDHIEQTY